MSEVKERGIRFTAPMIKALLAGTKAQTRRVMKIQPTQSVDDKLGPVWAWEDSKQGVFMSRWVDEKTFGESLAKHCPYGQPGDRLWVRESFYTHPAYSAKALKEHSCGPLFTETGEHCCFRGYVADGGNVKPFRTISSIFMPRVASRILLEIEEVRAERLQSITNGDALAEGCKNSYWSVRDWKYPQAVPPVSSDTNTIPRSNYASLWQEINGPDSWDSNPWVWVVRFQIVGK